MNRISVLIFLLILSGGLLTTSHVAMAQSDFDLFDDEVTKKSPQTEEVKPVVSQPKVDTKQSFSSNLKKAASQNESKKDTVQVSPKSGEVDQNKTDDPDYRETWLESLIAKGTSELFKSQDSKSLQAEKKRIAKVLEKRRSNAANFDISGIKLRMAPADVEKILTEQGYHRISQEIRVPNFIKWRSEELCRAHGIIGFERLKSCARNISRANGYEYIAHEVYNRHSTMESIEVAYTSSFTNNLSHWIFYKSDVPLFASHASEHVYINNLKIYDFWRRVDARYGKPDNTSEVKWGLGGKKPYLKASTGKLELVDPLLKDLDISRMINEDSRFTNIPYYSF